MCNAPASVACRLLLLLFFTVQLVDCIPRARPETRTWHSSYIQRPRLMNAKRQTASNACNANLNNTVSAPKVNVFRDLTPPEVAGVAGWLFSRTDLNLTTSDTAGEWDNTIALIENLPPNKTDVLAYLDGNAVEPTRYAHVVLEISSVEDAYYADIIVGPVPIDNTTAGWTPLEFPYTKKAAGRVRNLDASYDTLRAEWINNITSSVADITMFLYNGTAMGLDNDTMIVWGLDPYWQDDGRIIR